MKKVVLCCLFVSLAVGVSITANGQVSSLNEDFHSTCGIVGPNYPLDWTAYNIPAYAPISWMCAQSEGRPQVTGGLPTQGISCTNHDGTGPITDTGWLFTPQLNLSSYTGSIFLQFDTRYEYGAGKFSVLVSSDYSGGNPDGPNVTWHNMTTSLSPLFSSSDSLGWVTHTVDLTSFKSTPCYVSFRYTGISGATSKWILDNVITFQKVSNVPYVSDQQFQLTASAGTRNQISLSYSLEHAGTYDISIFDMTGKIVHSESIRANAGNSTCIIKGLDLAGSMYLVKMGNMDGYSTAKVILQ